MSLKRLGKIIGGICGYLAAGPLGFCIGVLIGHQFDRGVWYFIKQTSSKVQQTFFEVVFLVMGYIAKADGLISKNENHLAEDIMHQLELDSEQRLQAVKLFNQGKQSDFDLDTVLSDLKQACSDDPELLTFFLDIQIQVAFGDRIDVSAKIKHILSYMTQYLDIGFLNFNRQVKQEVYAECPLQKAYELLGISGQPSAIEVKKAYRKKMSECHPDKLMAKGLPREVIKIATERTQQIKQAYEYILAKRV
jgi:DnaJ like chaperone protein